MTREDISRIASEYFDDKESEHEMDEVFDLAKKSLEERKEDMLDKIRAEIEEQYDRVHPYNISCAEGLEMALEIIDNYKAESLEQEPSDDVPDTNVGNIYECSCGYGWDKSKVVRHHFCPNCGAKVAEGSKE